MLEPDPAPPPPRRRGPRIALVLLLALLLLVTGSLGFYVWATGASGPREPVRITIAQGEGVSEVANTLEDRSVIRSAFVFGLLARLRGISDEIMAGKYELETNMSPAEVFDVLREGPLAPDILTTTIPEGLRLEQVADRVAADLGVDRAAFLKAARARKHRLPPFLPKGKPTTEGFLFPKTYEFEAGVEADDVVERLLAQFEEEAGKLPWGRVAGLGISRYEAVIIGSLIEREAAVPEDRRKISAVIHNRLDQGMPLQIDATVLYALPEHKERLTYEDYEIDSPYNTYRISGLPPTPIASPGLASLKAALQPADADFLYYVVVDEETGRHAFTGSYDEFLELKDRT